MANNNDRSDYDILSEITDLLKEIGWDIAIPMDQNAEDGKVHGIVAGNEYFLAEMLKNYQYELYSMTEDEEGYLPEPSKKGTFH
jgi:hypothetical protein